jgi:1-phosphatidylinositol-3-phosphate 5-kinase
MALSLLLGIDEERHEISCGLVDTIGEYTSPCPVQLAQLCLYAIGSYTFAKTLEYKAKQNLNTGKGKEVTVIPPMEYHARFVNSIENYFLTCPGKQTLGTREYTTDLYLKDKWTKPSNFIDRTGASHLPSVV